MIQRIAISLFILLSFVTHAFAEQGENAILSRLTLSDLFGALGIVFGLHIIFKGLMVSSKYSLIYKSAFFLVLCFFIPIMFSLNIKSTLVESLIVLFLLVISVSIFYLFKDRFLDRLLPLIMYTAILATVIGVYDAFSPYLGLSRIFSVRAEGEVISGFRNAGQAGAYFLIFLTILFPLLNSSLFHLLSKRNKFLLRLTTIISVIFLLLTGKIAAYIGFFIGLFIYALIKRNIRTVFSLSFLGLVLAILFINLESISPSIHERISRKYETRIQNRIDGTSEGTFIQDNLGAAVKAFIEHPINGTGLGGFNKNYSDHEVHSTYFKMLGETGLIGVLGYAVFMYSFLKLFKNRKLKSQNPWADYLNSMLPFVYGCLVSWGYTYHIRKREFWILVALVLIVNYSLEKYQNEKLLNQEIS